MILTQVQFDVLKRASARGGRLHPLPNTVEKPLASSTFTSLREKGLVEDIGYALSHVTEKGWRTLFAGESVPTKCAA
jgi:hypothetical protein